MLNVEIVPCRYREIEVQLLGIGGVRPARRNPFGSSLKGQLPETGLQADDHPAIGLFIDFHPQHLTVKLRESTRVGTVDHCLFKVSDHTESMSAI